MSFAIRGCLALAAVALVFMTPVQAEEKAAVVYFSKAENSAGTDTSDAMTSASVVVGRTNAGATAYIGELLADRVKADLFSIKTVKPYPASFDETIKQNHREQRQQVLPEIKEVPDLSAYSTVYLGYPVWNMRPPQPVYSFLERVNLGGKQVVLFCTHDGYGAGRSFGDLKARLPSSTIPDGGLEVASDSLNSAERQVEEFLEENHLVAGTDDSVITARVAGSTLRIRLNGSMEAKQFKSLLPLSVRMGEFGGREYYGRISQVLNVNSKGQLRFEDGTLTYCPTNNTVAIFYAQSSRPNLTMEVYPLGKVLDDLELFGGLSGMESFEFVQGE